MNELQNKMIVKYDIEGQEIKLTPSIVKEYIVGNPGVEITNQEFKMFAELCSKRKLNPFLREAYLIKYKTENPAQLVVGKDAILKRAIRNDKFDGREQGIIVLNENGIDHRKGTFRLPEENVVGGWARVYRKDWKFPVEITVSFDEVAQKKANGELNSNWQYKGATMVEKVALVRALREAFAEDVGGMIDEDEVWDREKVKSKQREPIQHEEAVVVEGDKPKSLNDL